MLAKPNPHIVGASHRACPGAEGEVRRRGRGPLLLAALLALLLVAGGVALAQTGGPYNLEWHTFDGGGGQMSGGSYSVSGTIGQADAGALMSGGSYALQGGFWGGAASQSTIYSPLVLRNSAGS